MKKSHSDQLDLFTDPPPKPKQTKPSEQLSLPRENVEVKKETIIIKENINLWTIIKYIAYGLLVLVELTLTGLAMFSIGHTLLVSIGLVLIGVSASILGIYLFLRGDLIGVIAWGIYAVLFVLLNWSWTVGNMTTEKTQEDNLTTEREEMDRNTELINELTLKMVSLNQWATDTAESIERQIIGLQTRNKEIKAILDAPRAAGSSTFETMEKLSGITSEWWWLMALVLLQFFQVLVSPRNKG